MMVRIWRYKRMNTFINYCISEKNRKIDCYPNLNVVLNFEMDFISGGCAMSNRSNEGGKEDMMIYKSPNITMTTNS